MASITALQLDVSTDKSCALLFGKLSRRPIIKINGVNIPFKENVTYLGVVLNEKRSWLPHLQACKAKACAASLNIAAMRGSGWGITADLYKKWYFAVIQRIILYAAAAWAHPMHSHVRRKLMSIQRIFLLRISKAYRNTSTDALLVITGLVPLHLVAEMEAKNTMILRLNVDVMDGVFRSEDVERKVFSREFHPSLDCIGSVFDQHETNHSIQVFTDGSKVEEGVGSAFVAFQYGQIINIWQRKLKLTNSVFQAELLAILYAIKWLTNPVRGMASIYSDSLSSIYAIRNADSTNVTVREIRRILRNNQGLLNINWIRAHMGSLGNEHADKLAKEAAKNEDIQSLQHPMPASYVKLIHRNIMMQRWQEGWSVSEKGRDLFKFMPLVNRSFCLNNRNSVLFFTGHGPFPAFLHKHGIIADPNCVCGELGDPLHYACYCVLTSSLHLPKPSQDLVKWGERVLANNWLLNKLDKLIQFLTDHEKDFIISSA